MLLTKRELRQRLRELNALICEWDPMGVIGSPAPRDEYECLVGPLFTLLQARANEVEIEGYLSRQLVEHFGLAPDPNDVAGVAARVHHWFTTADVERE